MNKMPIAPARGLAFTALLLAALVGCGGSGLDKAIVSGVVTFQGEPIPNGDILFYPQPGTSGPVSGA